MKRLLLLSNSTNFGEPYLAHAQPLIADFLGSTPKSVLFIPFAGVTISWDDYTRTVRDVFSGLGHSVIAAHQSPSPVADLQMADAVVVGGGNTFRLVDELHRTGLMPAIRQRVEAGLPFIGWSAGSNVASPTLRTTNDMPIVEPPSFNTLDLVPFQINPHYTEAVLPNHGGETRADRLMEFLVLNPEVPVVGLPEGTALRIEGSSVSLLGPKPLHLFRSGTPKVCLTQTDSLDFLLDR